MTADYLAGFMDGEGSIMLVRNKKGSKLLYPRVCVTNTNRGILEKIAETFGGRIKTHWNIPNPRWKTAYAWTTTSMEQTRWVLLCLRPYLILKRPQADAVLLWFETKDPTLYDVLKGLNQRGFKV